MEILNPDIESYLTSVVPERGDVLQDMEKLADERGFPIVGPLVGRLCHQLARAIGAKRVFEMGSGFGYSAYWLAQALPEDGQIFLTENSAEDLQLAQSFLERGGLSDRAVFLRGDALELIQQVEGSFDIILSDVDKEQYPATLDLVVPRVRRGGLLITDNMLWHGRVLNPGTDRASNAVVEYTRLLFESKKLWTTIVPLRDGVGISLKL